MSMISSTIILSLPVAIAPHAECMQTPFNTEETKVQGGEVISPMSQGQ